MTAPYFDILRRREDKFVLWIPGQASGVTPPQLVLGTIDSSTSPAKFNELFKGPLVNALAPEAGLFELDPNSIIPALQDGAVYHYWFEATDASAANQSIVRVTDPMAYTVDYSTAVSRDGGVEPASVIKFRDSKLWPCDADGNEPPKVAVPAQDAIPDNNHMVIYELPISWSKGQDVGGGQIDVGTFTDVLALFDVNTPGDNFKGTPIIAESAIVAELGINALEILPVADAKSRGEWGYATANYFAPDTDFGTTSELVKLVEYIHNQSIRLFLDVVMAFGHDPYGNIALDQFHIDPRVESWNADAQQSHGQGLRDGYGGRSWRYIKDTDTYDPKTGGTKIVHPSWAFHQAHLHRWMSDFGVGGYRLDSVNNIANYAFIKSFKDDAWNLYKSRYNSPSDAKFLVIGEELSVPTDLISSGTLNALWNEPFQGRLRAAITNNLGTNQFTGDNLEWTVRKMIDCTLDRNHPFTDGAQAVNYITSHDTEGTRKERLFNFLQSCGVTDMERRAKLAFVCLLTAVGIPMIFAGEEFCDQMDRPPAQKQIDPVNYERKFQPWRSDLFNYVATLVKFRTKCPALGDDDTNFIHVDGNIMAWKRGALGHPPVVVVANFSDQETQGSEYIVHGFPETQRGDWREITQNRAVPREWVGREPLMHWEAKVYTYWKE
jgi:pullulanase